ncbi:MAG: hypothetical protein ACOCTI_03500 [Phycisphaeraceae bacterium]
MLPFPPSRCQRPDAADQFGPAWQVIPHPGSQPACPQCGDDLRGNPAAERCPECGHALGGSGDIAPGPAGD